MPAFPLRLWCVPLFGAALIATPVYLQDSSRPGGPGRENPFEPVGRLRELLTPPAAAPIVREVPVDRPVYVETPVYIERAADPRPTTSAAIEAAAARPLQAAELSTLPTGANGSAQPAEPAVEETRVYTLLYPNALDVGLAIRSLYGERARLDHDGAARADEYDEIRQRFRRFDLLENHVKPSRDAARDTEPTSFDDSNDTPALRAAYERGLDAERDPRPAIHIALLQKNNQLAVRSSDAQALAGIDALVRTLDVPTPQVLLEVKVLSLDLGDTFSSAFDFMLWENGPSAGAFTQGTPSDGNGGPDITGPFIYKFVDEHVRLRLQLLQNEKRISTLATPLLLVANNEVARLFVGEERPIVRGITTETTLNQNLATTSPETQIEMRAVGTTLLLTPNINADRTVTLRVVQETSDLRPGAATIPVVTRDGGIVSQRVDVVGSRSVSGTMVAKDGLTLAIGGLIEEGVGTGEQGVPFLMDLPLIGPLFRREIKGRSRKELVVLVRPWVLFTASEGQERSAELTRELDHPSAASLGGPLRTFDPDEAPTGGLSKQPFLEMFKYRSGLPDGL
jgi:general secretion pathway protein D